MILAHQERKIMIDKNYNIPLVYQKMNERGYTNAQNDLYLWLNEMEWIPINKIKEYEYDEGETKSIVPFAITGAGDKWVWIVADNGEAIQKEFSEHLFEPFTKGDASRKGGSGSGLGLSIAKSIIKLKILFTPYPLL